MFKYFYFLKQTFSLVLTAKSLDLNLNAIVFCSFFFWWKKREFFIKTNCNCFHIKATKTITSFNTKSEETGQLWDTNASVMVPCCAVLESIVSSLQTADWLLCYHTQLQPPEDNRESQSIFTHNTSW